MLQQLRILLLPFSLLYGIAIYIRNKLYDWGVLKSVAFDIPIIGVGNLAVGGSGKTPTVEYIANLLAPLNLKIAILSRGYGRKTKGFLLANSNSNSETIGDEPFQYYQKFKEVTVAVCERRVYGIEQLQNGHDLIILDDAYQHRAVRAGLNILLFEYDQIKRTQFLLPAGNLRESLSGSRRADLFLITKSPSDILANEKDNIKKKLDADDTRLFFSRIAYQPAVQIFSQDLLPNLTGFSVIVLTGIANPKPLIQQLKLQNDVLKHFDYPDHYRFTKQDLEKVVFEFYAIKADKKIIITTEKDSQRLLKDDFRDLLLNLPIYYLPIKFEIDTNQKAKFDETILRYASNA